VTDSTVHGATKRNFADGRYAGLSYHRVIPGSTLAWIIHDPTVARRLLVLSPRCFATERTAAILALLVNYGS